MDGIQHVVASFGWHDALIGIALFFVTFFGSVAVIAYALLRIPADCFQPHYRQTFWPDKPRLVRLGGSTLKNTLGLCVVVLGMIMALPGVPGQGLLTIVVGLALMDFRGKRRLEHRLIRIPSVFGAINKLRTRYGRPPITFVE